MDDRETNELIDRLIEGDLPEADAARLSAQLVTSAEARAAYWEAALVHAQLEDSLQTLSVRAISGQSSQNTPAAPRQRWRQWAAAVVGLVFGVAFTSVVWAYVAPRTDRPAEQRLQVVADSFESFSATPRAGFPRVANEWSGDLAPATAADAGIEPIAGNSMLRLLASPPRRLGYAWRILDLAEHPSLASGASRQMEVVAQFNGPSDGIPRRYQIRLAAFSQEPDALRQIWNDESVLFETVLQHVGRNVVATPDGAWKQVQARLDVPAGTRSLLICVAAGAAEPDHPPINCYVDDVRATFVLRPESAD